MFKRFYQEHIFDIPGQLTGSLRFIRFLIFNFVYYKGAFGAPQLLKFTTLNSFYVKLRPIKAKRFKSVKFEVSKLIGSSVLLVKLEYKEHDKKRKSVERSFRNSNKTSQKAYLRKSTNEKRNNHEHARNCSQGSCCYEHRSAGADSRRSGR